MCVSSNRDQYPDPEEETNNLERKKISKMLVKRNFSQVFFLSKKALNCKETLN